VAVFVYWTDCVNNKIRKFHYLKMRFKRFVFRLIVYLPLLILLLLLSSFSYNIIRLNFFNYGGMHSRLEGILNDDYDFKENITITKESIKFYNRNSAGFEDVGVKTFNYSSNSDLIFVYGASSVVSPQYDEVFGRFLEKKINENNKDCTVINFGMDGSYSAMVEGRITSSLNNTIKPRLIILYLGHNDYDRIYFFIRKKTSILKNNFFLKIVLKYLEELKFKHYDFSKEEKLRETRAKPVYIPYFTNIDWVIEPRLKKYSQKIKLISFNNDYFVKYNKLILEQYSKNIYDIIGLVKKHKIPIIIITPISNLEAEPFGINRYTADTYQKALKEVEYIKRINMLKKAKDNEVFSGHIRAKSQLNNFLKSINRSGVYILDLEKELIERDFNFSYSEFYDYVHLKSEAHKLISDILYSFIEKENLI